MCLKGGWFVSFALLISLIQSAAWMTLSALGALVYLCVIPITPYEESRDFFLVTTVKLYFEGPECIPDGSYLGQLNKDYRNPDVLRLFAPDKVFAVMVAYFIINAAYFILSISCWLNRRPKSAAAAHWQKELLAGWSVITLIICAIDVILSAKLISDVISLNAYMGDREHIDIVYTASATVNQGEIPYIPLLLALLSSRFIGIWLWNFVIGLIFFLNTMCCKSLFKDLSKTSKEQGAKCLHGTEDVQTLTREHPTSKNLQNGTYISAYDLRSHPNFANLKKSSEAVTRFSGTTPKTVYPKDGSRDWSYASGETSWQSSKPKTSKDSWEMSNEGYISDEEADVEKSRDFDHDLKNFEQGQGKIKIVKPPMGKPVEEMRV